MSRTAYEITVRLHLEPDEYPEEGRAWALLVDRVRATIEQARQDSAFAAIADELDPTYAFEVKERIG
ncbi:hypothetical protein [Actinomadura opuntiae]|uniref:hypothetical protein n=1 Tax=Actinomadura sp. OS1-43 TaxID=604315 RepID=UPI00255AB59F|nr:hypothetical protein [Actinomadura sp. OS1-43]MDL4812780.1 hypothetical protein [Actinomadura sp. OS1-43]